MISTEAEAQKLFCPIFTVATAILFAGPDAAVDSETLTTGKQKPGNCVASKCAMWRWAQKPNPDWKPGYTAIFPPSDTRSDPPMYTEDKTRGYCGLAGRPS